MRVLITGSEVGRKCAWCGEFKPWSEFYRKANGVNGRTSECKPCRQAYDHEHRAALLPSKRAWRQRRDPQTLYLEQARYKYGTTDDVLAAMLAEQGGLCASCGHPETATQKGKIRRLSIDHDHATGAIRGLLCNSCNRAIGYAQEDADRLEACAAYLRRAESSGS